MLRYAVEPERRGRGAFVFVIKTTWTVDSECPLTSSHDFHVTCPVTLLLGENNSYFKTLF